MKTHKGVDVQIQIFLTLALVGGDGTASSPSLFIPNTHWIGGWGRPRVGPDNKEKLTFLILSGLKL
jgi:hypothetical protein